MSLSAGIGEKLPAGYSIRRVQSRDYNGVTAILKVLTTVGEVSREMYEQVVSYWDSVRAPATCSTPLPGSRFDGRAYNPLVVEDDTGRVVATGTIFIESKVIHGCGLVGHIEDIAVAADQQGKRLGFFLIKELTEIGRSAGCYKIVLDCNPKNEEFYKKCGYYQSGLQMQIRFRE